MNIYIVNKAFNLATFVDGKKVEMSFKPGDKVIGTPEGDLIKLKLRLVQNNKTVYFDYFKKADFFDLSATKNLKSRILEESFILFTGLLIGLILQKAFKK